MGFFSTDEVRLVSAANPPIAVFQNFIAKQQTTHVLKGKVMSLSGDRFSVKDAATGFPVIQVEGKALSLQDRKMITDMNGNPLYQLRDKVLSLHKAQIGEAPDGRELFRVRSHMSFGSKQSVQFTNAATGAPVELNMKGDMFGSGSVITCNGAAIAQISRKSANAAHLLAGQQTYFVTVAAGVDLALIAGICIAFDEAENER